MRISNKLSFTILATGIIILILVSLLIYKLNDNALLKTESVYTQSMANEVAEDINQLLHEKIKIARTLANTPAIKKTLETSCLAYAELPDENRKKMIITQDEKWKLAKDPADSFLLKFTDNSMARYLKNQQALLKGEYGEIFIINKFGALVASTGKITTFSHSNKYWWDSSYNSGDGTVFIDDRGYDDSVDGYVLGIVVPVRKSGEMIGLLKCNLHVIGGISRLISRTKGKRLGEFKLIRSGGLVVFENGREPLSTRIPDSMINEIKNKKTEPFISDDLLVKSLVGFSEIKLTKGENGYNFGGIFESIGNTKGNQGESWYVLCFRQMSGVRSNSFKSFKFAVLISVIIILVLSLISLLFSRKITKPLRILNRATEKIGQGNFEYQIEAKSNDELGDLFKSFNIMADKLRQTTTSVERLKKEVSTRKQSEEKFRIAESKLKTTFDISPGIISVANVDTGYFLECNPAMSKILGFTTEELLSTPIFEFIHPDDRERTTDEITKQLKGRFVANFENRYKCKNGSYKWLAWQSTGADKNGIVHAVATDITERREVEKTLQESEERLKMAMNASRQGWYDLVIATGKIEVSPEYPPILGFTADEFDSSFENWVKSIHPDDVNELMSIFKSTLSTGGPSSMEYRRKTKNGNWKWLHSTGKIVEYSTDGKPVRMIGTHRDITEQKQTEEKFRIAESKLKTTFDISPGIISVANVDTGYFLECNPAMTKILGFTTEEFLSTPIFEFIHPDDRERTTDEITKQLKGRFVANFENRYKCKNGSYKWLAWQSTGADKNGIVHAVATDITESKLAEEQKSKLEEQLRLSQKLEAVGTLVGGIAHDFNNILTPILGYSDMALSSLDKSNPLYNDMKSIKKGSERAKELIDQIMTFSRQNEKERNPLRMQSIVKEAVKLLRPSIPSTIEIQQHIDSACKNVLADPTQIHQVVMNLCINAFQSMEEKGGVLTLELKEFIIDSDKIKLYPNLEEKEYVRLSVSDTGIGMDKLTVDRIFEPFFTTKETGKGSGMGLSVVHGIVKSHGGDIIVHSEPQKGSVFHVYLPVVVEENKITKEKMAIIPKGKESILIVDDEEAVAEMIKKMMERLGYSGTVSNNSQNALKMFKKKPETFDLIISDLTMPGMTGLELSEELHKIKPKLPIIIVTGYGDKLSPDIQRQCGVGKVIGKPIILKELAFAIRGVLED